jgi:hypothetical protein
MSGPCREKAEPVCCRLNDLHSASQADPGPRAAWTSALHQHHHAIIAGSMAVAGHLGQAPAGPQDQRRGTVRVGVVEAAADRRSIVGAAAVREGVAADHGRAPSQRAGEDGRSRSGPGYIRWPALRGRAFRSAGCCLEEFQQVMVSGAGGAAHRDFAGPVRGGARVEVPFPHAGALRCGGRCGELGMKQATVSGKAAALPVGRDDAYNPILPPMHAQARLSVACGSTTTNLQSRYRRQRSEAVARQQPGTPKDLGSPAHECKCRSQAVLDHQVC